MVDFRMARMRHQTTNILRWPSKMFIRENSIKTVEIWVLPIGHIQKFSPDILLPVIWWRLVSLSATSLVKTAVLKTAVKTAKYWSRGRQKISSSKIFKHLFLYSGDFPFIKAFFWNTILWEPQHLQLLTF